jgi:hypothetical protein
MLGFDTSDARDANLVNDDPTLVSTDTVSALP